MVFSSLTFIFVFMPLVLFFYFIMPSRTLKNLVLFLFSLLFYSWGEPIYILLMIFSTLNDYTFAQLVEKEKNKGNQRKAKGYFITSLVINIGLLGFFKYAGFLGSTVNALLGTALTVPALPLPIGISFYTFQTMSYSIDVYLGNVKAQKKFLPLATYVTLFPQLIAGPIVRYITVEEELQHRKESISQAALGLRRFIIGLGKKVLIANQMGFIADTVFTGDPTSQSTLIIWIGALAYTFQIYFDFSGYSDMAIGLGRIFGFHFLENFNYPYIAKSITEFWRRWHISLSTWFRDYVYIPLGGNRVPTYKVLRNLLIVWGLTGLWHGANWNYVLWGLYYGILLIIEKYLLKNQLSKIPALLKHGYTLFLVIIGWVIFRVENFHDMGIFLQRMFTYHGTDLTEFMFTYQNMLYALPVFILAILGSIPIVKWVTEKIESEHGLGFQLLYDAYLIGIMLLSIVFLLGEKFNPFIYFRF